MLPSRMIDWQPDQADNLLSYNDEKYSHLKCFSFYRSPLPGTVALCGFVCERLVIILLAEKHSFVGGNVFFFFDFFFSVERLPPAFIIIKSFIYLLIFLSMYTHVEVRGVFLTFERN